MFIQSIRRNIAMKRALIVSLIVVALLPSLLVYRSFLPEVMAAPLLSHKLDTIEPVTADWPQKEDNWCGAAVLQAYIDYAWRFHHGDENHYYTQSSIWDVMRDFTSSHFFAKGSRGIGAALPGQVGDAADEVRRLNIAYDFGVDPSALTWMMQYYGHDYYHFAIYRDGLYHATRWLLWTVEHHQEPVVAVVLHGSHYVLVIGYEAERSAVDPNGPGEISKVRYADPLLGSGEDAYKWRPWDSIWPWVDTWEEFFTEYTAQGDPDPSTGWYVPPPDLWQGGRVTVERDEDPDTIDYSPDWAVDGDNWSIIEHHDVTYLPDVKADWAEWNSTIVVRNNGSSDASASVIFYDSGGYGAGTSMRTARDNSLIPAGGTWELDASTAVNNFTGSAIVSASKDVSVVVANDNGSEAYAYLGIPSTPSTSGLGTGTEVYIPGYLHNYYGYSSTVYVQNTGAAATTIHAYFYNDSGSQVDHRTANVNASGQTTFSLSGAAIGSVRLTAGQPVAAVVFYDHPDLDTMAYSGISGPGTTGYLPVLFKNYYSWYSSYQTQETIGNSADVSVVYYPSGGKTFSLNPYGHQQVWMGAETSLPDGWQGSAKVSVTAGSGQVATAVTHGGPGGAQGYHGLKGGARDLIVPLIRKNVSGWDASLTVQNVGTANTQVTVRFYNSGGTEIGSPAQFAVQSGQAHMLYSELPGGVSSAWVHSNSADVVAVTNQGHTNGYSMGYSVP
jgi:hypothetical protein